ELLLGGPGAALLEQTPPLGQELLGVGRGRRRSGGRLVALQVALLVLLPRAAGAGIVAPDGGQARARLLGIDLQLGLRLCLLFGLGRLAGGGLGVALLLGGLGLFGRHLGVSVVAGDGTIP